MAEILRENTVRKETAAHLINNDVDLTPHRL